MGMYRSSILNFARQSTGQSADNFGVLWVYTKRTVNQKNCKKKTVRHLPLIVGGELQFAPTSCIKFCVRLIYAQRTKKLPRATSHFGLKLLMVRDMHLTSTTDFLVILQRFI